MNETEKEVLNALEKVKNLCKNQGTTCDNCIFSSYYDCELQAVPEEWNIENIAKAMKERKNK